jgi:hypothetical protein
MMVKFYHNTDAGHGKDPGNSYHGFFEKDILKQL